MKVCSRCKRPLPLSAFVRNSNGRGDGLHPWCRDCKTEYARARRHAKRAETLDYQRQYSAEHSEELAAAQRRRRATPSGALKHRAGVRAAEHKRPEAQQARRAVANALRSGRLVRPDRCERCGKPCIPHAHHHDYTQPLDVRWLCAACHGKEHRT